MGKINVAIIGVGNCASSFVQGVQYYKKAKDDEFVPGLMHVNLGGYHIKDINFVAAIDIDRNKVGKVTPGRCVPIVSRKDALAMKPDSIIVYAWNFADRIAKTLRKDGYTGEIFVPLPKPRFIEAR